MISAPFDCCIRVTVVLEYLIALILPSTESSKKIGPRAEFSSYPAPNLLEALLHTLESSMSKIKDNAHAMTAAQSSGPFQ